MKHVALATLILLGAPAAAMAGGMAAPVTEPALAAPAPVIATVPSTDWTGFYTGLSLGYGNSYTTGITQSGKMKIAGVNLGYRRDLGKVVVGGEISFAKDNVNVGAASTTINSTTALRLTVGTDLGRTLVYGSAGVDRANATLAGVTATGTGYSFGIGADYALTQRWTVGAALETNRYNDFNNTGVNLKDTALALKVGFRF